MQVLVGSSFPAHNFFAHDEIVDNTRLTSQSSEVTQGGLRLGRGAKGNAAKILGLTLVIIIIAAGAYWSLSQMVSKRPAEATVRIRITTFNWGFNTTYIPDFQFGKIYPSPTITVHQGQRVIIELRTLDITHGFAVDDLHVNEIVPPGETVTFSFVPERAGNFTYYCPVFCGVGHPYMHGVLQALP